MGSSGLAIADDLGLGLGKFDSKSFEEYVVTPHNTQRATRNMSCNISLRHTTRCANTLRALLRRATPRHATPRRTTTGDRLTDRLTDLLTECSLSFAHAPPLPPTATFSYDSGSDVDGDENLPAVDIDAIASAKSLGDAMRILAPQLEGLVSH